MRSFWRKALATAMLLTGLTLPTLTHAAGAMCTASYNGVTYTFQDRTTGCAVPARDAEDTLPFWKACPSTCYTGWKVVGGYVDTLGQDFDGNGDPWVTWDGGAEAACGNSINVALNKYTAMLANHSPYQQGIPAVLAICVYPTSYPLTTPLCIP